MLVRRALERAALDPDTPGALNRFLEIYDRRLMDHTVPYPGMHETLASLARCGPLAVLTNKPLGPSHRILEALGLRGFFVEVIGGDSPHGRKPKPAGLLALAGLAPTSGSVMVGDSPIDAATGARGQRLCPFVFARFGFGAAKFGDAPPDDAVGDRSCARGDRRDRARHPAGPARGGRLGSASRPAASTRRACRSSCADRRWPFSRTLSDTSSRPSTSIAWPGFRCASR